MKLRTETCPGIELSSVLCTWSRGLLDRPPTLLLFSVSWYIAQGLEDAPQVPRDTVHDRIEQVTGVDQTHRNSGEPEKFLRDYEDCEVS